MLARLRDWLHRLDAWLDRARLFWLAVSVVLVAAGFVLMPPLFGGEREPQIRWTGMLLQFAGLATIARGVHQTRRLFDRKTYRQIARAWWSERPRWRLDARFGGSTVAVGFVPSASLVFAPRVIRPTLEERVVELEREADALHRRVDAVRSDIAEKAAEHGRALEAEQQERRSEDEKLDKKLEAAAAGGLDLSAVGLAWLFAGVLLSTAAQEIAGLLS